MSYGGLVCAIKTREHTNADNLAVGNCAGYQVIVSKDTAEGTYGLFFMSDTQLSHDFCMANKLYRKHPETGVELGGYLESNRRVRTIKLRGETSDGLWMPLTCLNYLGSSHNLKLGDEINEFNGKNIAQKYETPATQRARANHSKQGSKNLNPKFPTFHKHYDTPQLRNNIARIPEGALITITEKLHGTSGRSGHLQCELPRKWWQKVLRKGATNEWRHVRGSRNVIIHDNADEIRKYNPQYVENDYRSNHHKHLSLRKGETIYYEIVGWTGNDLGRIMPAYPVHDKSDPIRKEIRKRFDTDQIDFCYDLPVGESEIYVYRITQTNVDGHSTELPWHQVVRRCEDMGLKHVPVLKQFMYHRPTEPSEDDLGFDPSYVAPDPILSYCKESCEVSSVLKSDSIKEGVCVRVEHPECDHVFKYKSFWFCHLEGIAKQDEGYIDVEDIS